MPINKQKHQTVERKSTEARAPKAAGTRIGVLQDWRHGSTSEKAPRRHGQVLRDGR